MAKYLTDLFAITQNPITTDSFLIAHIVPENFITTTQLRFHSRFIIRSYKTKLLFSFTLQHLINWYLILDGISSV